jgi:hypothetical protein
MNVQSWSVYWGMKTVKGETMEKTLVIGVRYLAEQKCEPFEDLDGSVVEFEPKTYRIKILPKPDTVIVNDGDQEIIEALPDHLKRDEWYSALNLDTEGTMWVHQDTYNFSPLESIAI